MRRFQFRNLVTLSPEPVSFEPALFLLEAVRLIRASVNRRLTRHTILELSRGLAFQHHAMHDPQLCQVIIRIGAVHGAPVVPNDEIAVAPLMAILKLPLKGEVEEGVEQRVALLIAPAEDTFDPVRIDV